MLDQKQQFIEQIKKAENILIVFNKTWNGDAIASALAMFLFLSKVGKKTTIIADKFDAGKIYSFLPAFNEIKSSFKNIRQFIINLDLANAKVDKVKYQIEDNLLKFIITPKEGFFTASDVRTSATGFDYDLVIILDTPDLESLGAVYDQNTEFFYQVPVVNIDHHADNEEYGQINIVELTAIATAEILYELFLSYSKDAFDENIATCLLCGIISKTRSFKTQNLTPQALIASSRLISLGARREEIVNQLYRSRSLNVLKLWGRVLARLTSAAGDKLVWSVLTRLDFEKTATTEEDLSEVVDELIVNIPSAKVIVLIYELPAAAATPDEEKMPPATPMPAATKALIYSLKNINSLLLAKAWNPAGTKSLAKIIVPKELTQAEKEIIDAIKENLARLPA
ncbi:MAG: DHH family phosphoesterase [Planctomycetes bacterium]|nr:DHH family phosphoesterase [Planctomycetota bacterium]